MGQERAVQDKVLTYLNGLSPGARTMLVRQLEQSGQADTDAELRLILDAARAAGNTAAPDQLPGHKGVVPDPARVKELFFEPYWGFVIPEVLANKQPGCIAMESIDGIWAFLTAMAMPETFAQWLNPVFLREYRSEAEMMQALRALRSTCFAELTRIDRETQGDYGRQRFVARMGGERCHQDLYDLLKLEERLPFIEKLFARLPAMVTAGEPSERLLVEQVVGYLQERPEDAAWVAAGLSNRLGQPVTIVRIATLIAGSRDPVDIRRTPASSFVDLAMCTVERAIVRYEQTRKNVNQINALALELRRYHECVRAVTTAIDLDYDATWRQRLADLRWQMSQLVSKDFKGIVPLIRRALRVDDKEQPTEADALDAIRATTLLVTARKYKDSLAVNELLTRVWPATEQSVENLGQRLIDQLRKAYGKSRTDCLAASDTLLKLSELIFGEEHSAILRRARDKAANPKSGTMGF